MATVEHCLYCFETLAAKLEKRTPMTLYQVQASWADYPKGLEETSSETTSSENELEEESTSTSTSKPTKPTRPRNPTLQRLSGRATNSSSSGSSTPASSSSSTSLTPNTTASGTPTTSTTSSTPNFVPIGINPSPRRSSQRAPITESPLFVTWNTLSSHTSSSSAASSTRSLRGCIGTFGSEPLSSGLASYALISALQDHRFDPISLAELPTLEVSVTLLTDFEDARDPMDWEIGVHGIRISFYAKNKRYGACYLPDVAVEQGWDGEETMVSLMRKAGWGGRREKWREVGDLKVVRFQGKAESLGWEEFRDWRGWVGKDKDKEGGEGGGAGVNK